MQVGGCVRWVGDILDGCVGGWVGGGLMCEVMPLVTRANHKTMSISSNRIIYREKEWP